MHGNKTVYHMTRGCGITIFMLFTLSTFATTGKQFMSAVQAIV